MLFLIGFCRLVVSPPRVENSTRYSKHLTASRQDWKRNEVVSWGVGGRTASSGGLQMAACDVIPRAEVVTARTDSPNGEVKDRERT